ncbi:MAG: CARDB domain-containing protein [Dehalococcoidia bacterium]
MAKIIKLFSFLAIIAVTISLSAGPASLKKVNASADPIVNGGFETGDLSGWTVAGLGANVEALSADSFEPEIAAPEGRYFALLSTGHGEVSLALGPDLDGNTFPDNDTAALWQTFTLLPNQVPATLSFRWNFLSAEVGGHDDFFMVNLNGSKILTGSVPDAPNYQSPFPDVPPLDEINYTVISYGLTDGSAFDGGACGFIVFSYTIVAPGNYTLEFTVADQEDRFFDSGLLIDAVRLELPTIPPIGGGGGGGGGFGGLPAAYTACPVTLAVDMQGNITAVSMTKGGLLCETCLAKDTANKHTLEIDKDTKVMLAGNIVPLILRFSESSATPPTPENTVIVSPVYELNAYSSTSATTPSPITISPPARLILSYDPDKLPENAAEVFIANYDTQKGWLALAQTPGVVSEAGKANGIVGHFSLFAVLAKLAEPASTPAKFETNNLSISPTQAGLNQEITFSVNVANTGGTSGKYSLELKVDGTTKSTKQVTIAAGASQAVNFTTTGDSVGKHQVEVAGLNGEFEVTPAAKPSQIHWWLIGGIIAAVILSLGIWMLMRLRRFSGY